MSKRQIMRISRKMAKEIGLGKVGWKVFLLGGLNQSTNEDEIRRSLKYIDEVINKKEHSFSPSLLYLVS